MPRRCHRDRQVPSPAPGPAPAAGKTDLPLGVGLQSDDGPEFSGAAGLKSDPQGAGTAGRHGRWNRRGYTSPESPSPP